MSESPVVPKPPRVPSADELRRLQAVFLAAEAPGFWRSAAGSVLTTDDALALLGPLAPPPMDSSPTGDPLIPVRWQGRLNALCFAFMGALPAFFEGRELDRAMNIGTLIVVLILGNTAGARKAP